MQLGFMMSDGLVSDIQNIEVETEDAIVDTLEKMKDHDFSPERKIIFVRSCLHRTSSVMIRNQAALALIDLIAADAADDIIEVLRAGTVSSESGSLLFALNEIDADLPLDILTRTALEGSYEARNEALFALEQNRIAPFDDDMEIRSVEAITPLLDSEDAESVEIAGRLLSAIEDRKRFPRP